MKIKLTLLTVALLIVSLHSKIKAQDENPDYSTVEDISKSTFISIPPASAFLLIDVAPNKVFQAGNTRSVKIDWTLRSYKSTPNLAIELQPIWLLYYNNGHIKDYRRASSFYRVLSSLSLSVGTVNWGPQRTVAYAAKLNLYSGNDPLLDPELESTFTDYDDIKFNYKLRIKELKNIINKSHNISEIKSSKVKITTYLDSLSSLSQDQSALNDEIKANYYRENWNTSAIDLGFGKIINYDIQTDSVFKLNDGIGMWLTGSKDLGSKFQMTGMLKFTRFGALNAHVMLGGNIRYGNPRFNFYTEIVHDIWNNPQRPGDLSSKEFRQLEKTTFSYGGELKLNNIIQLNFGVRTNLDQHLKLASILPTANVMCLMPL